MTNTSNRFNAEAISTARAGFKRNLGNGAHAMVHASFLFEEAFAGRDTTNIKGMIEDALTKGDHTAAQMISFLVRQVWPNAKVSTKGDASKGFEAVIKIKGIDGCDDALDKVVKLAAANTSLRSATTIRNAFKSNEEKSDFDHHKVAQNALKRIIKETKMTDAAIVALVKAELEAIHKAEAAKAKA